MKKSPPPQAFIRLIISSLCILLVMGCKKQVLEIKQELPENISRQELRAWISGYESKMPNGPKALLDKAVKTYYQGQMIVKLPLSSGGGDFYFTKTDQLEVQFIRIVSAESKINNPFNGYYEFIDMNTYTYTRINYKQGIRSSVVSRINKESGSVRSQSIKNNSWLGDFLWCVSHHIFSVPRYENGEWTGCWVLGGSIDPRTIPNYDGEGPAYQINLGNWFVGINPPNGPSNPWSAYYGGVSGGANPPNNPEPDPLIPATGDPYDLSLTRMSLFYGRSDDDFETGDEESYFRTGYEDNDIYTEYQTNQPWPTIPNVIPKIDFVGWNEIFHPTWQCMQYAQAQIAKKDKAISGYFAPGQTIQIYKSATGADANAAKMAIGYLISSLQNGSPVIVGVDDLGGSPNMQTDQTTDHFIVIVGMGQNAEGSFFTFYDNASPNPLEGASDKNKLYYKVTEGIITGKSQTGYARNPIFHDYIVTQIRKNKK